MRLSLPVRKRVAAEQMISRARRASRSRPTSPIWGLPGTSVSVRGLRHRYGAWPGFVNIAVCPGMMNTPTSGMWWDVSSAPSPAQAALAVRPTSDFVTVWSNEDGAGR
jgi:hypothetical protein